MKLLKLLGALLATVLAAVVLLVAVLVPLPIAVAVGCLLSDMTGISLPAAARPGRTAEFPLASSRPCC